VLVAYVLELSVFARPLMRSTGTVLSKRLEDSLEWSTLQREAADTLASEYKEHIGAWSQILADWRANPLKRDPFAEPNSGSCSSLPLFSHVLIELQQKQSPV
jgi:hypothetical protein